MSEIDRPPFSWHPIITAWQESYETRTKEGYLPELLAVLSDADLANTSATVRELRAKLPLSDVLAALYPRRILMGHDPSPYTQFLRKCLACAAIDKGQLR